LHRIDQDLRDCFNGTATAKLSPHGFIGTANPVTALQADESSMVRLCHQAKHEVAILEDLGLPGHGIAAILSSVRKLYCDSMRRELVPDMLVCLLSEREQAELDRTQLGMPAASGYLDADQLNVLAASITERLMVLLRPAFTVEANSMQADEQSKLHLSLLHTMRDVKIPQDGLLRRNLASLRKELYDGCHASAQALQTRWVEHVGSVLSDDAPPWRLQRFPSIVRRVSDGIHATMPRITVDSLNGMQHLIDHAFDDSFIEVLHDGGTDSPVNVYSQNALIQLASHLARLALHNPLPASDKLEDFILQAVRAEVRPDVAPQVQETCHAIRHDLQCQVNRITHALHAIVQKFGSRGLGAPQIREAGHDIQLKEAGFNAQQLREAGFSLPRLQALFSPLQLKQAGFDAQQFREAGFSLVQLSEAGFSLVQLSEAGFGAQQMREAGFNAHQLRAA